MKKLMIALCFMALNLKAQTVLINGQQYQQNDTVKVTTQYAHVDVISPAYVTQISVVYVGVTAYYLPNYSNDYLLNKKATLFRVNFFNGSKKVATYRCYLKK